MPSLISTQILPILVHGTGTPPVVPPGTPPGTTIVGLTSGPGTPGIGGQVVTGTAKVVGDSATGGTVTFTARNGQGMVLKTVSNVPVIGGVATTLFTAPAGTPPDTYTVSAFFSGNGAFSPSTGSISITVTTRSCLTNSFLGSAASFAVLGSSAVTNTGPTTIYGNVGVDPGSAITGSSSIVLTGPGTTYHQTDALALQAHNSVITLYNSLIGLGVTQNLTGVNLGGLTLKPGVYHFDSSAQLTGTLTLDFQGNPNAVFVFQIGSTLTTASGSVIKAINGSGDPHPANVYWQVGSSATLGTTTSFIGNILANQSVTLNTGAQILCGRALAITGAVTMDHNLVSINA